MTDNLKLIAHFNDGYFEKMPDRSWRRLNAEETAEAKARLAARVDSYLGALSTIGRLPASDPALPPDSTRLIVVLSLFAGFCLGTALTIAAYSLRLLS